MGAAVTIYETIDKIPLIDSSSEEGLRPEKLEPSIKLKNVEFSYPSRPDVQVFGSVNIFVECNCHPLLLSPVGTERYNTRSRGGTDSGPGWSLWLWQEHGCSAHSKILRCSWRRGKFVK